MSFRLFIFLEGKNIRETAHAAKSMKPSRITIDVFFWIFTLKILYVISVAKIRPKTVRLGSEVLGL